MRNILTVILSLTLFSIVFVHPLKASAAELPEANEDYYNSVIIEATDDFHPEEGDEIIELVVDESGIHPADIDLGQGTRDYHKTVNTQNWVTLYSRNNGFGCWVTMTISAPSSYNFDLNIQNIGSDGTVITTSYQVLNTRSNTQRTFWVGAVVYTLKGKLSTGDPTMWWCWNTATADVNTVIQ